MLHFQLDGYQKKSNKFMLWINYHSSNVPRLGGGFPLIDCFSDLGKSFTYKQKILGLRNSAAGQAAALWSIEHTNPNLISSSRKRFSGNKLNLGLFLLTWTDLSTLGWCREMFNFSLNTLQASHGLCCDWLVLTEFPIAEKFEKRLQFWHNSNSALTSLSSQ